MPIFSEEARELRFKIEQLQRLVTKQIARIAQYPISGGGTSLQVIRFTILTASCAAKTATVQVDARPCGKTSVTGEDSYEQMTVNDPQGCWLDEPDEDLVDREGWAAYMEDDYTGICSWEIYALCCDPDVC